MLKKSNYWLQSYEKKMKSPNHLLEKINLACQAPTKVLS